MSRARIDSEAAGGRLAPALSCTDFRLGATDPSAPVATNQSRIVTMARVREARKSRRKVEYIRFVLVDGAKLRDMGVSKAVIPKVAARTVAGHPGCFLASPAVRTPPRSKPRRECRRSTQRACVNTVLSASTS